MQNISHIKQRILQFVDTLPISKREFYAKTGISRGTLESSTGITEDTLTKFLALYQNVSPEWVLLGKGDMIKHRAYPNAETPKYIVEEEAKSLCNLCREKDKVIAVQREQIKVQAEYIELLKKLTK